MTLTLRKKNGTFKKAQVRFPDDIRKLVFFCVRDIRGEKRWALHRPPQERRIYNRSPAEGSENVRLRKTGLSTVTKACIVSKGEQVFYIPRRKNLELDLSTLQP